jgi:CRP/FNR family transcriptional regulator
MMNHASVKCATCNEKSCAVAVLDDQELSRLSNNISECFFDKGEVIFKEGTPNAHVFYLRQGLVKVHMKMTDQKDYILKIARAPCYLGLPTIFGDRKHRYGATALNEVSTCILHIETFKDLIHKNGNFAYEIIKDICKDELNNFRRYVNQSHKQIPGRLAGALIYFSEMIYKNSVFELALTRNEVSELIGVSRESVTRCLTQFKEDGIIKVDRHRICICNPEILHKIHQAG